MPTLHLKVPAGHRFIDEQGACPELEPSATAEAADIVASDDVAWLGEVRSRQPTALRILVDADEHLAGSQAELQVAHHVISTAATLHDVRLLAATRSVASMSSLRSVGNLQTLPELPSTIRELMAVLDDPNVDANKVQRVLKKDPALAAKTLKLANSPMFQRRRAISTLDRAIVLLGLANLRIAAMSSGLFRPSRGVPPAEVDAARDAGLLAVTAVRKLAGAHAEVAATAALMLEIGRVVLLQHDPGYVRLRKQAEASGTRLCTAELQAYGTTHAEQGARLLHSWGLPLELCQAIALSHTPVPHPQEGQSVRLVTFAASELVDAVLRQQPTPASLAWVYDANQIEACHAVLSDQLLLSAA